MTKIMGIVNVTPDSFSDGGKFMHVEKAVEHAYNLVEQGADIIDIGGESTRPQSVRIPWEVEFERVQPVLKELENSGFSISLDTMNSQTAMRCLDYGIDYVNDVSGGLYDEKMYSVLLGNQVKYICQHWRVNQPLEQALQYWKIVHDVMHELHLRVNNLLDLGVERDRIILDPGLGFYKDKEQSWELLANVDKLKTMGFPILIGASRKRMTVLYDRDKIENRDEVTARISAFCADKGVWAVRVHNVALTKKSIDERVKNELR